MLGLPPSSLMAFGSGYTALSFNRWLLFYFPTTDPGQPHEADSHQHDGAGFGDRGNTVGRNRSIDGGGVVFSKPCDVAKLNTERPNAINRRYQVDIIRLLCPAEHTA